MVSEQQRRWLTLLERRNRIVSIFTFSIHTFILGNMLYHRIKEGKRPTVTVMLLWLH